MELTFGRFVTALRNADVRASPAETLTAFEIVERIGIANKALLKDSLALALAKSKDEKTRFDETFERFFALAFRDRPKSSFVRHIDRDAMLTQLRADASPGLAESVANVLDDERDRLALRIHRAGAEADIHQIKSLREKSLYVRRIGTVLGLDELDAYLAAGGPAAGDAGTSDFLRYLRQYFRQQIGDYVDAQYKLHLDASGKRAILDAALKSNLDQLPVAYHEDVRRVVGKMAEKLTTDHRRRRKRGRRGVLDIKKTLRRNVAYDGALFDLKWRQEKREPGSVFVLCDVSNSVARVARFLLLFLYELTDLLPNIRAFAFSSRLGEVTETMRERPTEIAIEEALFTWGKGNTDYARAFADFRELCGSDIDQHSTLIVLGDARSNYYDPRVDIFEELTRRAKQTFWLNPETRDQWHEGDSEMRRYAAYCFRVETCNKLRDIERFADRLLVMAR
ncbi:MAG: VWA domain-containing protein [Gammaproteobacteria bacterium]|nr:VWA domain-containing protein [Gammaproteobacteria bacterium]